MDITNLLSMDLAGVDVSRPLIAATQTDFDVVEIKIEANKNNPDLTSLVITLATKYELKSNKNTVLKPGFKHVERLLLTPTGEYTQESVLQSLKRFQVAAGGTGPFGDPAQYLGRTVTAKVSIREDKTGQYDAQNQLRFIEKKA